MNYIPVYVTVQSREEGDMNYLDRITVNHGVWLCEDAKELMKFILNFNKAFSGSNYFDFDEPRLIYVNEDMWNDLLKNNPDKVKFLSGLPEGFHKRLPQFVKMGGTALRHMHGGVEWGDYGMYEVPSTYYRDAGHWSVKYEWRNGLLYSVNEDHESLDGQLLEETTKEYWRENNAGYV